MAVLTLFEIFVLCLAGFAVFRNRKNSVAESVSYAVLSTLMLLSLVSQAALLIHLSAVTLAVEILLVAGAFLLVVRERDCLKEAAAAFKNAALLHPTAAAVMAVGCGYLALLAIFIPPGIPYWNALGRVLLYQQQGLFQSLSSTVFLGPAFPLNHAAPAYLFLRFGSDLGVGIFGWLAYVSIASSTYALARRYSWPSTAVTVALIVISMPRLVFHGSSPGNEIIPAAAGLFCLLAAYRVVERLKAADLFMLVAGIAFTVSDGRACFILPLVLLALTWVLLVRRHGTRALWFTVRRNRWAALSALLPLTMFSQGWLFLWNGTTHGRWVGTYAMEPLSFNADGLQGSLANMIRYLLESAHFTLPVERFFNLAFRLDPAKAIERIAHSLPGFLAGGAGLRETFFIAWEPNEIYSWFGPFGFLLVIPAVLFSLRKGPRRLKSAGVAIVGLVYLMSLVFAWSPGNARLFTCVFVCGGFFVAFFLPPWRFGRGGKLAFQWVSAILIFYALTFNTMKPMVPVRAFAEKDLIRTIEAPILKAAHFDRIERRNIWLKTAWGADRIAGATDYFGDRRVTEARIAAGNADQVAYITDTLFHLYPYLLTMPAAQARIFPPNAAGGVVSQLKASDVVLCFGDGTCDAGRDFFVMRKWDKATGGVVGIGTTMLKRKGE